MVYDRSMNNLDLVYVLDLIDSLRAKEFALGVAYATPSATKLEIDLAREAIAINFRNLYGELTKSTK